MAARELLDGRRAALAHLRPPGDDDEIHHARASGDVTARVSVGHRLEVRLGPDPRELLLNLLDRMGPRTPPKRWLARLGKLRELDPATPRRPRADREDLADRALAVPARRPLDH